MHQQGEAVVPATTQALHNAAKLARPRCARSSYPQRHKIARRAPGVTDRLRVWLCIVDLDLHVLYHDIYTYSSISIIGKRGTQKSHLLVRIGEFSRAPRPDLGALRGSSHFRAAT